LSVYLLPDEPFFPPAAEAEPDGLIAIGGDLSTERLIQAYAHGIFPWFQQANDIFWYSPDPRMVLFPWDYKFSDSFRRVIKADRFDIGYDTVFKQVINQCAAVERPGQDGTWISEDFIRAYCDLHDCGMAHSVEVFSEGELVGGLYGVSLGNAFFGESMFFKMRDASKIALYALVKRSIAMGIQFIDCQVETDHLKRQGAVLIPRADYLVLLEASLRRSTFAGKWK